MAESHRNISMNIPMVERPSYPASSSHSTSSSASSSPDPREPSSPIPIRPPISKTDSEARFYEDTVHADYKDYCMYLRLVSGIRKQQAMKKSLYLRHMDDLTISNIVSTRCIISNDDKDNKPTFTNERNYQDQDDNVHDGVFFMDI
eukprot:CAMPEP_0195297108 /NCGR_PEP_ID=MMETSP0707-20130614/20846_1 /TAXON_ID=33640 /ORGANISM="Asterionellopsis glacialis, Strain CCMP134" /LENGTH=145 /DNA_ID=CAMNT_0040358809 /DNA_START=26 /DNA_END=463 /DNA_ORIENTATION=+